MSLFLESPVAVVAIGAVGVAVAAIFYAQSRSRAALGALVAICLLTAAALVVERVWLTPTERVRAEIADLFDAIEANDLPAVLTHIDATAVEVRGDAETIMSRFTVDQAGQGGDVSVEFASADSATAFLKPLIKARHTPSGATGAYFDDLSVEFVRRGERWLVSGYRPATDWRAGAGRLSR